MCLALRAPGLWLCFAALQNLIPSFPWIAPTHPPPWRNPRKGRDQILPSGNTGDNAGGFPPGFPPVTSSASPMFPFPFHPSMLASLGNLGVQRSPPPRAATPPPPPKSHSPVNHAAKEEQRGCREDDEAERIQRRLRHESSAKDDETGKSCVR